MDALRGILRKYWGYDEFRPLQAEAMQSVVEGRDSVVVMPTGGGKSLCFQAPALHLPGLAVVVSPLISLMKDQVDALVDCGVPAACVNSTLSTDERRGVADEIRDGRLKLLYLSPERLMTERTLDFLKKSPLSLIAIDEAHCISDWGHDFRPEYRMLRKLKECFPGVAVHAYTATATRRVREDIARELQLSNPSMLVGSFDRPNLVYRVARRGNLLQQIREVIDRYPNDSGIIYAIRRKDVDQICESLKAGGYQALPYHAGMTDNDRKHNQEAFINDRAKIIVATVAFGMGIDKSNVRYVIHAGAPKSLESYQQESGRAGRDGLESECWLLFNGQDFAVWRKLQADLPPQAHEIALTVLKGIETFCCGVSCRHRAIMQYFGQDLDPPSCNACDVCLAELDLVDDALIVGQKILSCVLRVRENFGAEYTAQVLTGSRDQRILENEHDKLSTWGLLSEHDKRTVRDWIEQLIGQGCLEKTGEYAVLSLTTTGRRVLRGEETPRLLKPAKASSKSAAPRADWEGVDRELFEALRGLRKQKAEQRGLPPFVVFSDATLRDLARRRPSNRERLLQVQGIGEKKCADYGAEFLHAITEHCRQTGAAQDVAVAAGRGERPVVASISASAAKQRAMELFAEGKSIDEVREAVGRAQSTTVEYLAEHIEQQGICDPTFWLNAELFERIVQASREVGVDRLKPIRELLGDDVGYDQIRIALACLKNLAPSS